MLRRPDALPYAEIAYIAAHVIGEAQLLAAVRWSRESVRG